MYYFSNHHAIRGQYIQLLINPESGLIESGAELPTECSGKRFIVPVASSYWLTNRSIIQCSSN